MCCSHCECLCFMLAHSCFVFASSDTHFVAFCLSTAQLIVCCTSAQSGHLSHPRAKSRLIHTSKFAEIFFSNSVSTNLEVMFLLLPWSTNLFPSKMCVPTKSPMRCLVVCQPLLEFSLFFQFAFPATPLLSPSQSHGVFTALIVVSPFDSLSMLLSIVISFPLFESQFASLVAI